MHSGDLVNGFCACQQTLLKTFSPQKVADIEVSLQYVTSGVQHYLATDRCVSAFDIDKRPC
eukprot:1741507-Amphidinium_carterae.2